MSSYEKHTTYYIIRIVFYTFLFFLVVGIEQYTDIDIWLQSFFYNHTTHSWSITTALHKGILGRIVYRGYKDVLILSGVLSLCCLIYYTLRKEKIWLRIALIKYLCALLLIPLLVALLKPITNVYCPAQLDIFNGFAPYVRILESYPAWFTQAHGRCFPAGHATSGFLFIIVFYALQNTPYAMYKWYGLLLGMLLGFLTGIYQIARGEHFFTHTLATMVIAFAISWAINEVVNTLYSRHSPSLRKQ